jgi:hypothetical protein
MFKRILSLSIVGVRLLRLPESYQHEEPQSLPWKVCNLRYTSNGKHQAIQFAELSHLVLRRTNTTSVDSHLAQKLYQILFEIELHVCKC